METRKVQITGGSTYMITLPKKWAQQVGLEAGAKVRMLPLQNRAMVLQPESPDGTQQKVGTYNLEDEDGAPLTRSVISLYIAGYEVIQIQGGQITSSQRSTIRRTTQSLIGPEIVEESSNQVVIRNLSDLSELSINETLSRIHQIARSMFEDAIKALIEKNDELAVDVGDRDDDVDRLFLAISRRFRVMLYDILAEDAEEITRVEYYDYQTAAKQLERIADHSKKIANIVPKLKTELADELAEVIEEAATKAVAVTDQALKSLKDRDIDLANEALSKPEAVEDKLLELSKLNRELAPQTSQLIGIVADSIDRVKEYGINIAETSLNSSYPLPSESAAEF